MHLGFISREEDEDIIATFGIGKGDGGGGHLISLEQVVDDGDGGLRSTDDAMAILGLKGSIYLVI